MSDSGVFALRSTEPGQGSDTVAPARRRVLIVEDDAAICSSLGEALQEEGFDVDTAENGREALELLGSGTPPSAIVLDLMMPVMDGWDFRHEQLKNAALKDIPVVVITAAGFSVETIRTQFGDVTLIPKPVSFLDLLAALRAASSPTPPDTTRDRSRLEMI
jgi:DNA-binding response OmpR family regulator